MSLGEIQAQVAQAVQRILLDQYRKYPDLGYENFHYDITVRQGDFLYE